MPGNRTAVRKENRAGAVPAPQAVFFTEMREETPERVPLSREARHCSLSDMQARRTPSGSSQWPKKLATNYTKFGRILCADAGESFLFCGVELQHGIQPGHLHQRANLFRKIAEPHPAAGLPHRDMAADQASEIRRIHVREVCQIHQYLQVPLTYKLVEALFQASLALALESALHGQDDYPFDVSLPEKGCRLCRHAFQCPLRHTRAARDAAVSRPRGPWSPRPHRF